MTETNLRMDAATLRRLPLPEEVRTVCAVALALRQTGPERPADEEAGWDDAERADEMLRVLTRLGYRVVPVEAGA